MAHPVERALLLWNDPPPGDEGITAFRTVYADPLSVNGVPTDLSVLVDRARMLHGAFEGFHHEMLARFDTPDRSAFTFLLRGRHVGPLVTPLGVVAPTGRHLEVQGMDMFELAGDRVTAVWAVADYLGLLIQAGVAGLIPPPND